MNITTHTVAPEEVMAFLDGELSRAEAQAVAVHIDQCAECAGLAEQLRGISRSLSGWSVAEVPASLDREVSELAEKIASAAKDAKPAPAIRIGVRNRKLWMIGGGCAAAAALLLLIFIPTLSVRDRHAMYSAQVAQRPETVTALDAISAAPEPPPPPTSDRFLGGNPISEEQVQNLPLKAKDLGAMAKLAPGLAGGGGGVPAYSSPSPSTPAPMIARTVSLTILAKDFAASRASIDTILARHRGYAAQLNVSTMENAPRNIQASLRIPAQELDMALADFKALGRVENETQSGEEVTQQHADLVARLKNSREEEVRLQAILQQRTGKIEDVLKVEEEIASVRSDIERMEAEQQALEHRVDFATVDLRISEEYKAQFNPPAVSGVTRVRNSFVAGMHNASETVLGIVLFFEEVGPTLLIWLAILGLPAFLVWRRYRRMHTRI